MSARPTSRRDALLIELCAEYGYCQLGLSPEDLLPEWSSDQIATLVLRCEGLDPAMDRGPLDEVRRLVDDWLFDPSGRGVKSGLPR